MAMWAEKAYDALIIAGCPLKIPQIWEIVGRGDMTFLSSQNPQQTLRNEMRRYCENSHHKHRGSHIWFYQPSRGTYDLLDRKT